MLSAQGSDNVETEEPGPIPKAATGTGGKKYAALKICGKCDSNGNACQEKCGYKRPMSQVWRGITL
jgi:hypothetical protein